MNLLELVTETLRAIFNDLATVAPEWLHSVYAVGWHARNDLRAEQTRLPIGDKARQEYAETVGRDGLQLLTLLEQRPDVKTRERVQSLRQVWERHYARSETGALSWRKDTDCSIWQRLRSMSCERWSSWRVIPSQKHGYPALPGWALKFGNRLHATAWHPQGWKYAA